jgi:hypothetical protein
MFAKLSAGKISSTVCQRIKKNKSREKTLMIAKILGRKKGLTYSKVRYEIQKKAESRKRKAKSEC